MKEYICINLNEFHKNQANREEPGTTATILFISAKNQEDAEAFIHRLHPETAWFVINKQYADQHIVCADN